MSENGLVTIRSSRGARETMDQLAAAVKAAGLSIFARIDHAAGAAEVNLPLRPTELLIFGNAKGGTPLMQARQTIGIDLPLKVLVWEDEKGQVWVTHNDPHWLAQRHGIDASVDRITATLSAALVKLTSAAAAS